jgi:cytochrome c551/c552
MGNHCIYRSYCSIRNQVTLAPAVGTGVPLRSLPGGGLNPAFPFLAAMISEVGFARTQAPEVLLHQYNCYICHANDETKTGPAYVNVAAKYGGKPQRVAIVGAVVRKGAHSGGPWHAATSGDF